MIFDFGSLGKVDLSPAVVAEIRLPSRMRYKVRYKMQHVSLDRINYDESITTNLLEDKKTNQLLLVTAPNFFFLSYKMIV